MKKQGHKIFMISYPLEFGPEWMCKANLMTLLFSDQSTRATLVEVEDLTECSLKELIGRHSNGETEGT